MLTELVAYAGLHSIPHGEERHEFVRYLRVMDAAYMKQMNTKDQSSNV